MIKGRLAGLTVVAVTALTLARCSMVTPIAYHVDEESVDIAFCDTFTAASVVVDCGK